MTKKDIHVVPHDDGWATKKEGATRAGVVTRTQQQAIERAVEQAKREHVEVVTLPLGTASHDRRRYAARFSWAASQARSNCIGLT